MKLRKIEPISTRGRSSEAYVSISKSGTFSFSKPCLEKLHMKGEKHVTFLQDEEDPQNWYMEISGEGDVKLRYYGEEKGPAVSSSSIAKQIKKSTMNDPDKTLRAKIGNPIEYEETIIYPLLIDNGTHIHRP